MNRLKALIARPWFGPLVALVLVYALFAALRPDSFTSAIALELMLRQTAKVALCSVGMTLVIITAGIDLSVGSIVALVTVIVARQLKSGSGAVEALVVGVLVGVAAGLFNGGLIAYLRITPFIVTLGSMSVLRGVAKGLANEQKIDADARGLDELMRLAPQGSPRLVPWGVWIAALVALLGAVLLDFSKLGRHIVAVGSSPATARLSGISLARVLIVVYALAGLCAGLAGVLEFGSLTVGDPTDSIGLELSVIAAVVIGGGSLSGGQGSILGSLLGALLMTVIATGSTHLGIASWIQEILTGVIIVVAVGLDRLRRPAVG